MRMPWQTRLDNEHRAMVERRGGKRIVLKVDVLAAWRALKNLLKRRKSNG